MGKRMKRESWMMDLLPGLWINKIRQVVLLIWWVLLIDANWLQNDLQTNNNIKTNLNHKLQIIVNIENKLISAYLQSNYLFNKLSIQPLKWTEPIKNAHKYDIILLHFFWVLGFFFFLFSFFFFIWMNEKITKKTERQIDKTKIRRGRKIRSEWESAKVF
jgi:ATP-dependent Zn protease